MQSAEVTLTLLPGGYSAKFELQDCLPISDIETCKRLQFGRQLSGYNCWGGLEFAKVEFEANPSSSRVLQGSEWPYGDRDQFSKLLASLPFPICTSHYLHTDVLAASAGLQNLVLIHTPANLATNTSDNTKGIMTSTL